MASPSAPDPPISQSLLASGSLFAPEETSPNMNAFPTAAMAPMHDQSLPGRTTRSRTQSLARGEVAPSTRSRMRRATETRPNTVASAQAKEDGPVSKKRARSSAKKASQKDEDKKKPPSVSCCICMCDCDYDDLAGIDGCEHKFCFTCIEKWAERENSCPLCKNRFTKIDRMNKKRKKGQKNTKKVRQRSQRDDLVPGAALESLLASIASRQPHPPHLARLIVSESFTVGGLGRLSSIGDQNVQSSDEEGESLFSSLFRSFGVAPRGMQMQVLQPIAFSARTQGARSYASNSNNRSAGNSATDPIEIEDSDDDDTVEVVHVRVPEA